MAHATAYIARDRADGQLLQAPRDRRADSGATWAPVVHQLRRQQPHADDAHPGAGRIEDRTVDGSCNPYLAATAVLAAGLDGIERGLDPGEPDHRPTSTSSRRTSARRSGIERAAGQPAGRHPRARAGRGAARRVRPHAAARTTSTTSSKVKQREWQAAHEQITQWELDRYLQLY